MASMAGLVGVLLLGLVLEHCAAAALMRTGHGMGLGSPMSWLGAATTLMAGSAWVMWQLALLLGPLLGVLSWQRRSVPAPRLVIRGVAVLLSPLVAALIVHLLPMQRTPTVLLAGLVLWAYLAGALLAGRMRRNSAQSVVPVAEVTSRPALAVSVLRTPDERAESTVISLLPAALAQNIHPHRRPLPPPLAEATQHRAMRTQESVPYALRRARRNR